LRPDFFLERTSATVRRCAKLPGMSQEPLLRQRSATSSSLVRVVFTLSRSHAGAAGPLGVVVDDTEGEERQRSRGKARAHTARIHQRDHQAVAGTGARGPLSSCRRSPVQTRKRTINSFGERKARRQLAAWPESFRECSSGASTPVDWRRSRRSDHGVALGIVALSCKRSNLAACSGMPPAAAATTMGAGQTEYRFPPLARHRALSERRRP
jgi:hypothetical protein